MCAYNVRTLWLCAIVCVLLLAASACADVPVTVAGQWGGPCWATAVSGNRAYMGMGPRLVVVDVSTPSSPTVLGMSYIMPDAIWGLAVSGNYVYAATYSGGLQIVNVSNPASPVRVGEYDTPGYAHGVAVSGNYAYVADDYCGLQIINVSNPASPTLASTYDSPGTAFGVAISGNYAYVADDFAGVEVLNVSNPASPSLAGAYDTPGYAHGIAISGNYAYVADDDPGMQVLNISNPAAPSLAGTYNTTGIALGVSVVGNYAYVADYDYGLQVISIANPASPTKVGTYDTNGYAQGVAASGSYVYVADYSDGMQIINVSTPASPTLAGGLDTSGYAISVAVYGNRAYVADYNYGLRVIDITNPGAPGLTASCKTSGYGWYVAVAVSGNYVYLADYTAGLQIIDVSNPAAPVRVGGYDTPGLAFGVAVSGNYAYVADYSAGLQIINISNPAAPVRVGGYDTTGNAYGVALSGNYAFVADGDAGLKVIDITDPAHPRQVAVRDTSGTSNGIVISGGYAYIADYASGLQIINISNPLLPSIAGVCDTPGKARSVALSGHYACVADYASGLQVIDIANPAAPVRVGGYDTSGYARGVAVSGNYVYIADDYGGLVVTRLGDAVPTVSSITPNAGQNTGLVAITDLAGADFEPGAGAKLTKAGQSDVAAVGVTVVSPTRITCSFDLNGKASGQWNVVVTNPNGQSGTLTSGFTVSLPPPTVTSITPDSGSDIGSVSITNLAGSGFQAGAAVKLTKTGQADIAGASVIVVSPAQITCSFDLTGKATGQWNVVVTNPDLQSAWLANGFTVAANQPTVAGITPSSALNTGTVSITNLAGGNFLSGASVKLTKSGQTDIAGTGVTVVGPTQITCSFDLTGKTAGQWNVVVTNSNGQSGQLTNGFAVEADQPPVINFVAVTPALAAAGDQVHVTVDATDDATVTGVTANGTALINTGGSNWGGDIVAASGLGVHTVNVVVCDSGSHSSNDAAQSYKTVRLVAASNLSLSGETAALMAGNSLYATFGRVTMIDSGTFDLDDGSASTIRVSAAGHGLQTGDYAAARGIWRTDLTPRTLCCATVHITRIQPAP